MAGELSPIKVNKKIQPKFCKVITPYGEGTGYFIDADNGILLSSFHLVGEIRHDPNDIHKKEVFPLVEEVEIQYAGERIFGKVFYPPDQDQGQMLRNYAFYDTVPIQIISFEDGVLFSDGTRFLDTGKNIPSLSTDKVPKIGEKIYFGGFPLGHEEYTFSVGMISSVIFEESRMQVLIEAPIAPGHSGSPVFIERKGKIYHVGTITSELAIVSDQMKKYRTSFKDPANESFKSGEFKLVGTLGEVIETLLANLSTGKGKALRIDSLDSLLYRPIPSYLTDCFLDFSVHRTKPDSEPILKLFEYINQKCRGSVTAENLRGYLLQHPDKEACKRILNNIGSTDIKASIPIPPNKLTADVEARQLPPLSGPGLDQGKLRAFYKEVLRVSKGEIQGNQRIYTNDELRIYPNSRVTEKFFKDHISGETKKAQAKAADTVAERRFKESSKIKTSTTLREDSLPLLSEEVETSGSLYANASEAANQQVVQGGGGIVEELLFKTQDAHQLQIREKGGEQFRVKSTFFYSVAKKGEQFFMHHFAGTKAKAGWEPLEVEGEEHAKRESYFKRK